MRALFALALVACGSSRSTPTKPARGIVDDDWRPSPTRFTSGLEPRPADLDLLDLDPDPVDWRWPLTAPPQVAPSGELSAMFGIKSEWGSLCAARRDPRGVDRDEALTYLRAWCDAPPDLALAKALVPSITARTSSIAAAATIDLAAVLESQLAAREAVDWLRASNALHDFVLDALAATYLANDRLDDTRFVVRTLGTFGSYGATTCRRAFRELFVADRVRRDVIRRELAVSQNAVCSRLSAHANCTLSWGLEARGEGVGPAQIDLDRCTSLLLEKPELMPHAYLTIAAAHWPSQASFESWYAFASFTANAAGAPRAEELILAAFTNAIRVSNCESQLDLVRDAVAHSTYQRVRALATTTTSDCQRRSGSPPR